MKMELKLSTIALALALTACGGSDAEDVADAIGKTEEVSDLSLNNADVEVSDDGKSVTVNGQDVVVDGVDVSDSVNVSDLIGSTGPTTSSDIVVSFNSLTVANPSDFVLHDPVEIQPSDSFIIGWVVDISQNSQSVENETNNLYTAKVYLSDDELTDSNDLLIAENSCEVRGEARACNQGGALQCSYLTNGDNIITCNSTYNITVNPVVNYESSLDVFLDAVPKQTNIVVEACLVNDASNCQTTAKGITLY